MSLLRTSLIGGISLSSLHFFWVILLASGFAQSALDFIFKLHMLSSPFQVQAFDLGLAMGLIGITFLIGCFYGALFFLLKNKLSS
ncbi:hypothetical protein B6A14_05175 [Polynucleobacter hirudinilacicola]|uniref:Uncharacterized protein n=1 Tax=Polynucleobacter hirudinilacicola TaxID=1743166 RepID=A0A210RW74_9BURK|nr:hypothetical protein B6A14_05175 [Polynucleobacter hirudinilacicola]